jgi:hypothetical protein
MKLKLMMILILLSIISLSYAQDFTLEKVADIYEADDYRKIVKDEDRILAIELDELPLWGLLGANIQSELILLGISGDYVFSLGTTLGSSVKSRLYKVLIENGTLTLLDSINFYDDEYVSQILLINNHLFVMPHFYYTEPLYI